MRIHVVGLGKLGLPVALALEDAGHTLTGWDTSEARRIAIQGRRVPESAHEPHLGDLLAKSKITLAPLWSEQPEPDIVLIAVQTPHQPEFEGCVPLDRPPQDFDYSHLKKAMMGTVNAIRANRWNSLVAVISTCLPGTFERELQQYVRKTRLDPEVRFAYHPLFIAMGSVIEDFRHPEFHLFGAENRDALAPLAEMYAPVGSIFDIFGSILDVPHPRVMSIASAELTKVAYNAWIGFKLLLTNGLAELADEVDANVDDVMGTLKLATDRLVSTRYMDAGMGDGGGCHPRDQIALSWLADEVGMSHNPFRDVVRAREAHAKWLADIWCDEADKTGLPMIMLGDQYKPNSTLRTGSHARLVGHYASARGREITVAPRGVGEWRGPACWFLATPHDWVFETDFRGVMVDPWGRYPTVPGLNVVRPGRRA